MSTRNGLLDELRRSHDGDPWHGSSARAIVADVTAGEDRGGGPGTVAPPQLSSKQGGSTETALLTQRLGRHGGEADVLEHVVGGVRQVRRGVDQRAVEIENKRQIAHAGGLG